MRFALVTFGILAVLLGTPRVAMDEHTNTYGIGQIDTSVLAPLDAPVTPFNEEPRGHAGQGGGMWNAPKLVTVSSISTGARSLMFIAAPSFVSMPLMPDIPEPIGRLSLDVPPIADTAPVPLGGLVVSDVKPVFAATRGERARVTGNSLNMRSGPAKRFKPVAVLRAGDNVQLVGERKGDWVQVRLPETGLKGWVFYRYVVLL